MLHKTHIYCPAVYFGLIGQGQCLQHVPYFSKCKPLRYFEYLYLFVYSFKELTCFYFLLEVWGLFVWLLAFHTHTLCDFLLMQQGILMHKNIFKGHLILHRLKNIGTGFVSLILKTYCVILDNTCEL